MAPATCYKCKQAEKGTDATLTECPTCGLKYHLRECLGYSSAHASNVDKMRGWKCPECVVCTLCKKGDNQDQMPLCDMCDCGYHTYCLPDASSALRTKKDWLCPKCLARFGKTAKSPPGTSNATTPRKRRRSHSMSSDSRSPAASSHPPSAKRQSNSHSLWPNYTSPAKETETRLMRDRKFTLRLSPDADHESILANFHALSERLATKSPRRSLPHSPGVDPGHLDELALPTDLELFRAAERQLAEDVRRDEGGAGLPEPDTQIRWVQMGEVLMRAWYPSPYPDLLAHSHKVYVCEYCLKCVLTPTLMRRHTAKCVWKHPPGNEIYRDGPISFWEVDGKLAKIYCQNLCLLAKLFLDHKTLYFDVEPFLFYVMTEFVQGKGCQMIGYFSKEKETEMNCNLSCILTMPQYQRKGYGRMLIDFSYLLSRVEDRIGSPEHPLSDMGLLTYRNYWRDVIFEHIVTLNKEEAANISIKDLSAETGIHPNDIISTLQYDRLIRYYKGKHIILTTAADEYVKKRNRRQQRDSAEWGKPVAARKIKESCLNWVPDNYASVSDTDNSD